MVKVNHIDAFINANDLLPVNMIPGFFRYEISDIGKRIYEICHAHFHWEIDSIVNLDDKIFAYYTNLHVGVYILSKDQLKQAIDSGGFLQTPRKGNYGTLETAATDPYSSCGLRKMICISDIENFSLHHMPNTYYRIWGVEESLLKKQIDVLLGFSKEKSVENSLLFETKTNFQNPAWEKSYNEECCHSILNLISNSKKRILSVGCAYGGTELVLKSKGFDVVVIPLDSLSEILFEAKGIKVTLPSFDFARKKLVGKEFDYILFNNLLQYVENPTKILDDFLQFLTIGGEIIISIPNFHKVTTVLRLLSRQYILQNQAKHSFNKYNLHLSNWRMLSSWLKKSNLEITDWEYFQRFRNHTKKAAYRAGWLQRLKSDQIIVSAKVK